MATLNRIKGWLKDGDADINPREIQNIRMVEDQSDLPEPSGGFHQLEDGEVYHFVGFVTSPYGLELANSSPLVCSHGGVDGFIHVGGNTAIKGDGANYLHKDMYVHAPGGTIYDLSAGTDKEMLVESVSFSDAAGLGNIASLGTVDGFRVPTWKGVNFEDFNEGLTLTGTTDKIFFQSCPFRGVSESNVTILDFDSGLEVDLVDIPNSYVKGVQSDTEVINVDPAATINSQFQYRGTTHDETVTPSNILTGDADKDKEPYWVSGCYPLSDTAIYGGYDIDSPGTITINSQASSEDDEAAYEPVDLPTTDTGLARFTHSSPNEIEYVGKRLRTLSIDISMSAETGNDEILAIAVFKNGSILTDSETKFSVSAAIFVGGVAGNGNGKVITEGVEQGDTFDVRVANLGSATDVDVDEMTVDIVTT